MWVGREAQLNRVVSKCTLGLSPRISAPMSPRCRRRNSQNPLLLAPNHVLDTTLIVRPG